MERIFFLLRRNNYRPKKLACWSHFQFNAFNNIHEPRTPYPVMIAETISSACFVLLVVIFCCMIKIYTMVKNIQPSRNERVHVVYARDNQRALPVERGPTVYFPQAERSEDNMVPVIIQHTVNHKRDSDSHKCMTSALGDKVRKMSVYFSTTRKRIFFVFTAFNHSSCIF